MTDKDRELMQQALEALEAIEGWANHGKWVWPESALEQAKSNTTESITALREMLAQPEQEPVAKLDAVAAEREKVAAWMTQRGYATGHGDTTEDLLRELEWQIRESEREACAKVCDDYKHGARLTEKQLAQIIRARGDK